MQFSNSLKIICLAVATSCVTAHKNPPCVSKCGMLLEDKGNGSISCDTLQEAEDKILSAMDKEFCSTDGRMCYENACQACFGWQLSADDDVLAVVPYDLPDGGQFTVEAVGLSNCEMKWMWLGANQDWRHGSIPHELFHVVLNCQVDPSDAGVDQSKGPGHVGWKEKGYYDVIDDFRAGRR